MKKLSQPRPTRTEDNYGYLRWNKASQSLFDLFGIRINPDPNPSEVARLPEIRFALMYIRNVYKAIAQHGFETRHHQDPVLRPKLFCGDKFATKVKEGAEIPDLTPNSVRMKLLLSLDPGDQISSSWKIGPGDGLKGIRPWVTEWQHDARYSNDLWCNEFGGAGTVFLHSYVYICESSFHAPATINHAALLYNGNSHAKTLQNGTRLDGVEGLSTLLLHELLRLYLHLYDLFYIMADEHTYHNMLPPNKPQHELGRHLYGYEQSYMLARLYPMNAAMTGVIHRYITLQTVDTYVMFAMSMLFEDFTFEGVGGWAKPLPALRPPAVQSAGQEHSRFQSRTRKLQVPQALSYRPAPPLPEPPGPSERTLRILTYTVFGLTVLMILWMSCHLRS
ncbi:uncharacterized protein BDZ99DRAFT_577456 [Mytilinidion resinicola]|uniref:Uncharacterized protein n=1 Tax=Mytilinidion resinicola TaxID=574789 RepID=A0A6A6Y0M0_9PEZI|nr:uncharacterized protein BDZ99DRAFT_577456 [Mytilinidion resinicola]KAF2801775.1 hypothetical protein BDZ99DRAFT_577456 [Mytilinidion resinicola]